MTASPVPAYELRTAGGLTALGWPALDALGVDAVVTTRDGGVSTGPYESLNLALHVGDDPAAVIENRRRAATALGADLDDLVFAAQVHGRSAVLVTEADRGRGAYRMTDAIPDADALVTNQRGVVLAILVADCVPIVLFDPSAGVLATVHAGWRGTVAGVTDAALDVMASLGAQPAGVVAGIGPAVSPRTYQVGDRVARAVRARFGDEADALLVADGPGHWRLDLPEANRRSLQAAGVPVEAISLATVGTGAGGPFFSDRAARPCGRFALLARLPPPTVHGEEA